MEALRELGRVDMRWALAAYVAAVDLWCIVLLARAPASPRRKVLWALVVLLCPLLGCVFWYVLGPTPEVSGTETPTGPGP